MFLTNRVLCGTIAIAVTAGLLGCTTNGQSSRTKTGALTGTLVGAGAGALIDKDEPGRGALIGAAAGAAIGGGIGHLLQRQKAAMEKIEGLETEQQTVLIQQPAPQAPTTTAPGQPSPPTTTPGPPPVQREALLVRTEGEVFFAQGSAALTPSGATKLRQVAEILNQNPDSDVYIRGFASPEGSADLNLGLSRQRGEAVRTELITYGVQPSRLHVYAMGETSPIITDTEADLQMSRRVEIIIVPSDAVSP